MLTPFVPCVRPASLGGFLMVLALFVWQPDSIDAGDSGKPANLKSIEAGRKAVATVSSPLSVTWTSWQEIWKQWGLAERPEAYGRRIADRYGLVPGKPGELPLGLTETKHLFGKYLSHNCLLCHAGKIAGQTVIGLGNSSLDFQTLLDDLDAGEKVSLQLPFKLSRGRGLIEAFAGTIFLVQMRDSELNMLPKPMDFGLSDDLYEDLPAWWLYRKKKTTGYAGTTDRRAVRPRMMFLLAPAFTGEHIKSQEPLFRDIQEFLKSLEPPRYPFAIDKDLAARGRSVFAENCSECHGTYGPGGEYPNRIIPHDEIGTDPHLAHFAAAYSDRTAEYWKKSWFARERGPNGEPYFDLNGNGYQAPPLDGVWATAPYFHNGSVPTIEHVLNSRSRPAIYTRSYETDEAAYDKQRVGWKIEILDAPLAKDVNPRERRRIVDTTVKGRRNTGHTFGDHLSDADRKAVLEYLKTL